MTTTTETDSLIVDIPILARGRVIEPGDDAVEFGGRVGARFRAPDPRSNVTQLVLADPSRLSDLHEMPVDEIIEFLAELGPLLALDVNPHMERAFRLALEAGELTEPVLRAHYDLVPGRFRPDALDAQVEKVIGKAYLDGWVEQGTHGTSTTRVRAFGTRQVHVIAGNAAVVAADTVARGALSKGDCLIKLPSNDPLTAWAIVRTMIDLDADHPVTRHFAVAYWKGGDTEVERQIYRPSRIEKLTAWGGNASMQHIQQYLVPGIELIAMNPKLSISIVGHEALETAEAMESAASGVAYMAGRLNQTGCFCTRVVYVECDTTDDDLERLERFGHAIHQAFLEMPPSVSTAPKMANPTLEEELEAIALEDEFYRVIGDTSSAGVVVSRTEDPVEFAQSLCNRVVNLVPVPEIAVVPRWVSEETQTVGVYPETLRERLRDELALHGVQRIIPLGHSTLVASDESLRQQWGLPHDGIEPLRRMVRWVVDQSVEPV